jgi:hypothetical protein
MHDKKDYGTAFRFEGLEIFEAFEIVACFFVARTAILRFSARVRRDENKW